MQSENKNLWNFVGWTLLLKFGQNIHSELCAYRILHLCLERSGDEIGIQILFGDRIWISYCSFSK